jgi:hypothetical protein
MLEYESDPLGMSNLPPTFALARDSTLILFLCVPQPRHTSARKALDSHSSCFLCDGKDYRIAT